MAKAKTAKAVKAAKVPETVYISEADQYLFAQGTHYDIYKKLGAHQSVEDGKKGMSFAVWAPHAASVFVIGTFNSWNETANQMEKLGPGGIYKTFIPDVGLGELYKFLIITPDGRKLYKADPFANQGEVRPGTASVTTDITNFKWSDSKWIEERSAQDPEKAPVAIYECHIGSWMKHPETEDGFYNYREFADRIVEYLKKLKYTHIELMGIAEHPFDGSWGYQVTGYYAPTSRYGTPEDFAYLVNKLHRNKIGVILDWVPAHFPKDAHGLADFDGEALFEYPDPRMGEHPEWGTKVFNYAKSEVKGFLITNALYWIKEFHVDGLRVDAVASMLYLDYGRKDGEWVQNRYGGNTNLDAIEFFKHFNSVIRGTYPGIMTIAEESTAWPNVTGKIGSDSLGFTFKWNMGWMHDFCEYMKLDPYFRKNDHHALTFAMSYNDAEDYILPLSHDEVVHLKCSMVNKMPGYKVDKYANLRVGYTYMLGHSGKKLLFMGHIKDGSCCAAISGTWNAKTAQDTWGDNYAATKLPTYTLNGEQVQMASFSGYKLVGVNPHSANVGVAMMLADYITNEDNQAKRFNDRQLGPSNIAVNESEAVQSAPAIAALAEQSDYATLQRVGANYWSSAASLGEILVSGDTQGKTTQQLVDDAVAGITAPVAQ